MKNKYLIKSDNYNHTHKFIRILGSNYFRFIPEENWMHIYITYLDDNNIMVDTEGGPCLTKNWENNEIIINDIILIDNALMFELKEKGES